MVEFDLPKERASIIKVIGVGGGGCNAVNHMFKQGIKGVNFVVCNTDAQHLNSLEVPNKIHLGPNISEGLGAGSSPEIGRGAAIESVEEIREILKSNTKMVFITSGMGGGTGTGGAPVIAQIAKELGILTVGIVTMPFSFEGNFRKQQAELGISEMKKFVDTILIINNDKLRELFGNLGRRAAFAYADNILATGARGIAEIISMPGDVNVDFRDVATVLKDSGVAIMGTATAEGESRAVTAIQNALASPLLNDNDIRGAKFILLNITTGSNEVTMDEIDEVTSFVQQAAGNTEMKVGYCNDDSLGEKLSVTVIAAGFDSAKQKKNSIPSSPKKEKIVHTLDEQNNLPPKNSTIKKSFIKQEPKEETQPAFQFDLTPLVSNTNKKTEIKKEEFPQVQSTTENKKSSAQEETAAMLERSKERLNKLKNFSMKFRGTTSNVNDLEKEPAYLRKNIQLENVPHSSESNVSRYTLNESEEEENGRPELKKNNSFLHDKVD